jgi:tRNA-(ms[2]io[6]A)-hydroxylase
MFELKYHTGQEWVDVVMADFDRFLQDHAAAEKKSIGHGYVHAVTLSR